MAVTNTVVPELASCELGRKAMIEVLARVGDKWTILIVAALSGGPMRYGQLQRHIGDISQRMLTLTLKGLTEDGLVRRTAYPTIPPRVEYELTELGLTLRVSLMPLRDWALKNMGAIMASKAACSKNSSAAQTIPR
jgi:DNA-binding HxlR family transcriptional regulator